MDVSIIVATFGDPSWRCVAERAIASAEKLNPREVIPVHGHSLHEARNEGADLASGEHLIFLDADDELHYRYLIGMERSAADLRAPAVQYVKAGGPGTPKIPRQVDLADGNWLVIGTLVRREMFHAVGGFKDWPMYEDWDLWQRCWLAGASIEAVPKSIYIAHVRNDSRNRQPSRAEKVAVHRAIRQANGLEEAS